MDYGQNENMVHVWEGEREAPRSYLPQYTARTVTSWCPRHDDSGLRNWRTKLEATYIYQQN